MSPDVLADNHHLRESIQYVTLELPTNLIEVRAPWGQTGWCGANKVVQCCADLNSPWDLPLCLREADFGQISAFGSPHPWTDGRYRFADFFQLSLIFQRKLILNTEAQHLKGYANLIYECVPAATKKALIYHLFS